MLSLVLEDETLLLYLLQTLQPVVSETAAPVTKKARLDGSDPLHGYATVLLANNLTQATQGTIIHCRQTPTINSVCRGYWRKPDIQ